MQDLQHTILRVLKESAQYWLEFATYNRRLWKVSFKKLKKIKTQLKSWNKFHHYSKMIIFSWKLAENSKKSLNIQIIDIHHTFIYFLSFYFLKNNKGILSFTLFLFIIGLESKLFGTSVFERQAKYDLFLFLLLLLLFYSIFLFSDFSFSN